MTTTAVFRLSSADLDPSLLEKIKSLFAHREVEIIVRDPGTEETDYLASASANREQLDRAISDLRESKNTVEVDPSIFQ